MIDYRDLLRVVLVAPRNPLNIGAAARAMSNFGFMHLRVVNPYEVAYSEAKSAVNAGAVIAGSVQYPSLSEAVADCRLVVGTVSKGHRVFQHAYRRLEHASVEMRSVLESGKTIGLVFGSEKFGLSNDDMSHCHSLLYIPTREEHESMNLGQAVAVCLYELARESAPASVAPPKGRAVSAGDVDRINELLTETLELSGYIHASSAASARLKIRRIVRRLDLREQDARLWLGILRQILWKLKS